MGKIADRFGATQVAAEEAAYGIRTMLMKRCGNKVGCAVLWAGTSLVST